MIRGKASITRDAASAFLNRPKYLSLTLSLTLRFLPASPLIASGSRIRATHANHKAPFLSVMTRDCGATGAFDPALAISKQTLPECTASPLHVDATGPDRAK